MDERKQTSRTLLRPYHLRPYSFRSLVVVVAVIVVVIAREIAIPLIHFLESNALVPPKGATVAEDGKSTIKDGKKLDSLISNVMLLMKKRGDI